jgi:UDP-N-acetylglucosamine--N-acetylmuramyl-(pentapeptide) pyrophosphoryl-undecaprenol N-acetylglucosamine transferase
VRLMVAAGGTGGHVYPALVVLQDWLTEPNRSPGDTLWVGSQGGMEADLVARSGLPFTALPAGGLRGVGWIRTARNAVKIVQGVSRASRLMRTFQPDVLFVTGGYACVAATVAAWRKRVPVLVYLPDIVPGLAIRLLSRLASRVAVTSQEAAQHIPAGKAVVTGYPVRPELWSLSQPQARASLGLPLDETVLLVLGGSRGARSLNRAVVSNLAALLELAHVVHISGSLDAPWVLRAADGLPAAQRARYHPFRYLHAEMPAALVAADLVVARAGASTLGEFPAAGLPSVLVPYPYSGQHQQPNAAYLARHGAARVLADGDLEDQFLSVVSSLLNDPSGLADMARAARALARPEAASNLVAEIEALARNSEER